MRERRSITCQMVDCDAPAEVWANLDPIVRINMCRGCARRAKQECAAIGLDLELRELPRRRDARETRRRPGEKR
jgi:hypothetical protein